MKKSIIYQIAIAVLIVTGNGIHAQVVVRDHRIGKEIRYKPRLSTWTPLRNADNGKLPNSIATLPVLPYTSILRFPGNGNEAIGNRSAASLSGKLILNNGNFTTNPAEIQGRTLLFYTDTLELNGNFLFNLSKNNKHENGFLMISCRVLKLSTNGVLTVMLSDTQSNKYRNFYLFAEKVFLNGQEVFDEAKEVMGHIKNGDRYKKPIYFWSRMRAGERPQLHRPAGLAERPGYKVEQVTFNPIQISIGFLPVMNEINPYLFRYFCAWITQSYQQLYNRLLRNVNDIDKLPAAMDFIQFLAYNQYDFLDPDYQDKCNTLIEQIISLKQTVFKSGFQFERTIHADGVNQPLLSSINSEGIKSFLLPTISLVNTNQVNNTVVLGFQAFDESDPGKSYLDFDLTFATDARTIMRTRSQLRSLNDQLSSGYEELKFSNLYLEGPDIIATGSSISPLGNHQFNIRLCIKNDNTLLFNKLFSGKSTAIQLKGNWSNRDGTIQGNISIPVSFARISGYTIQYENGTFYNHSPFTTVIDYIPGDTRPIELSPALLIKANSRYDTAISGVVSPAPLPHDAVTFLLNPENYGNYFEQTDNSDRIIQELQLENLIPAAAADSLSGQLDYIEVIVTAKEGDRIIQKKANLSPAGSLGDKTKLLFLKKTKNALNLSITGNAIYQNGEYTISPAYLQNGEMMFMIKPGQLKKKE